MLTRWRRRWPAAPDAPWQPQRTEPEELLTAAVLQQREELARAARRARLNVQPVPKSDPDDWGFTEWRG